MKSRNLISTEKNQKGQAALLIVLITMTLLLFVGLVLTNIVTKRIKTTRDALHSVQAYYLADAGTEMLLYRVKFLPVSDADKIDPGGFNVGDELMNIDIDLDGDGIDNGVNDGKFISVKGASTPPLSNLVLKTTGYYKNTARAVQLSW